MPPHFIFCRTPPWGGVVGQKKRERRTIMKGMKTGGRKRGTPNKPKDKPLLGSLEHISVEYFVRTEQEVDGKVVCESAFDRDFAKLTEDEKINVQLRILEFHTPKRKAVEHDITADINVRTIEDKLRSLCAGNLDEADEEDED